MVNERYDIFNMSVNPHQEKYCNCLSKVLSKHPSIVFQGNNEARFKCMLLLSIDVNHDRDPRKQLRDDLDKKTSHAISCSSHSS